MKKSNHRNITRNFLNQLNESSCGNTYQTHAPGSSHHDIDPNKDGIIEPGDLFDHFDSNKNGILTTGDYVDHIDYHTNNPETLDKYREDVPCNNSYNMCHSYHENDHDILINCIRTLYHFILVREICPRDIVGHYFIMS